MIVSGSLLGPVAADPRSPPGPGGPGIKVVSEFGRAYNANWKLLAFRPPAKSPNFGAWPSKVVSFLAAATRERTVEEQLCGLVLYPGTQIFG